MDDEGLSPEPVLALKRDHLRGASELARQALEDVARFVEQCEAEDVVTLARRANALAQALRVARPSMASVNGLVERWQQSFEHAEEASLQALRERLSAAARDLIVASHAAVDAAAEEAAALIPKGATLITLSRSSTLVAAFRRLVSREVSVVVSESRPLLEGRVLAGELDRLGIQVQLITEAQLGHFVGQADIALVGADAVLADGSLVNKAGTYLLALAAREADVPFWVCCESFKKSPLSSDEFPLEEMGASDLEAPSVGNLTVRSVTFDITPSRLVTRWIDEYGSTLGRPR
jgi:translation initiation factor eIF-2B subunit delta